MQHSSFEALLTGRKITDLANTSSYIYHHFENLNWVGFYLYQNGRLELGPFQGKPACTEIAIGRGVCGRAAQLKKAILVPDVHEFEDHIVCDPASSSELVVPLLKGEEFIGVLDLDSPIVSRFSHKDQIFFESMVEMLVRKSLS